MKKTTCIPKRKLVAGGLAGAFVLAAGWAIWGNCTLAVTQVCVSDSGVPTAFDGLRIVHISDLHNAQFGAKNERLIRAVRDCTPDVIALTGDLVDSRRTDIGIAVALASELCKIAPVYYVPGNHEARMEQYGELTAALQDAGVVLLANCALPLEREGDTILLMGLADPYFAVKSNELAANAAWVAAQLGELRGGYDGYTVLLSHRPELFETYASCGVNVALCGHAHGGQIRLPLVGGVIAPNQGLFPAYDAGLYQEGHTAMIVSRGLGNSLFPVRVNNRPEIVVAELCRDMA